jgi:hypothetical protein
LIRMALWVLSSSQSQRIDQNGPVGVILKPISTN